MSINVKCPCGRGLVAEDRFAGTRAECPFCGRLLTIPAVDTAVSAGKAAATSDEPASEILEFLDPPNAAAEPAVPREPAPPVLRRMFEALLDPRSIQWLLILGGSLSVLGLLIWLVSKGIFEDSLMAAVAMGVGSLAVLGAGWWVALKTRFRIAGQALTFLGCVIAPLNLWFYHAQGLVTVDGPLWIGAAVCCLLYVATVLVLRDPLFLYAIQAGVALTVLLLLADLGKLADPTWLSLAAMVLGLISLHAERAFPADETAEFNRRRFGRPLFYGGHLLVAASLITLFGVQLFGWFYESIADLLRDWNVTRPSSLLATSRLLAAGIWLAGAYAYIYSDLIVKRTGRGIYSAALCLVMAQLTFLLHSGLALEWLIIDLAITALVANAALLFLKDRQERLYDRALPRVGMLLNALPLLFGFVLHVRATSEIAAAAGWSYSTGWLFVAAMAVVVACNRIAAWLYRETASRWATVYHMLTAMALLIGAAGLLRVLGFTAWTSQAPLLMIIPILYLVASYLWRGRQPEAPLYWVGHVATLVILAHVFVASIRDVALLERIQGENINLLLGIVFLEATVFYALAACLRRRSANVYLAAAAACGAIWQFLGYFAVLDVWHSVIFSGLGLLLLAAARVLGLERVPVWREQGTRSEVLRGIGLPAFQSGAGILLVAFLATFIQGLGRLALGGVDWLHFTALAITVGAALVAALLSPAGTWRRVFTVAAVALAGLGFLMLNVFIDLSVWQKLEIFCVVAGLLMLVAAHVARFRESESSANGDLMGLGLWVGSLLATLPLLIATFWHWSEGVKSLPDELALVTVTVLMLAAGLGWKTRATTLFGGGSLLIYLVALIASLVYRPQVAVGAYLAVGGLLLFGAALFLSIYREKLLALPDQIAKRQGIFQIMDWK